MDDGFINMWKRPSALRQEAINRYKTGGEQAVAEYMDSLSREQREQVYMESARELAELPLKTLFVVELHFSLS